MGTVDMSWKSTLGINIFRVWFGKGTSWIDHDCGWPDQWNFFSQNFQKKNQKFRFCRVKLVFATGYRMVKWGTISHGKIL